MLRGTNVNDRIENDKHRAGTTDLLSGMVKTSGDTPRAGHRLEGIAAPFEWRSFLIGNPAFSWREWRNQSRPVSQGPSNARVADHFRHIGRRVRSYRVRARLLRAVWVMRLDGSYSAKRVLDIFVSASALMCLVPLLALVAIVVKLDSRGPVLYSQTRVGLKGETFKFWKFRSMYIDADKRKNDLRAECGLQNTVRFKLRRDPRITGVGQFLRKYSIDELPQLWNVLIGDMTLVGPRPPLPDEVARYSLNDRIRLEALPGITCYWQVYGRSKLTFEEQVELDATYLYSRSLFMDIKILLLTVPAVLRGDGAY